MRVLVGTDDEHLKCIAASTNSVIHLALEVQEDTTKDVEDDWVTNEPVGIDWDAQVDALVIIDAEDTGGNQLSDLQIGQVYVLRFSQTAGATGEKNRDAVADVIQLTGSAILSDLQITSQNADLATATVQFTGSGDLSQYHE